jgi:hypothetical protein
MKTMYQTGYAMNSGVFLTGNILLAGFDFSGLLDYAARAATGGLIWIVCKIGADYFQNRMKKKQ